MRTGCLAEAAVLLVAAVLCLARLGANDLGSADEAVHAQVAREMVRDGHWLFPTCRGEPYFEKPPLKFWLTAATFRVAGESEFTARFWSALFGLGTVWSVMRLGRLFFNRGVGVAAGFVLATTYDFLFNHCARTGELDSALIFFLAAAVAALWKFRTTGEFHFLYQVSALLALGVLIKGQMVLVPLLWLPLVWWISPAGAAGPRRTGWWSHLALAALLFLAIATPWFFLQAIHYGSSYWDFLFRHNLAGYLMGTVEDAQTTVGYYLEEVIRLDYPWPPIVVLGGLYCYRRKRMADFPQFRAARAWLFGWIIAMGVILTVSKTKLPWYHLPIWIPLSILGGLVLERWWNTAASATGYRLWLALNVGLLFLLNGFGECLWDWIVAWYHRDDQTIEGYGYYFLLNSKQHSYPIALAVLASATLVTCVRLGLRRQSNAALVAIRLQVGLIGAIAVGGAWLEVLRFEEPEAARETAQDIVNENLRQGTQGQLHLFDSRQEHAPHYRIPPSLYYYLASERSLHLYLHPNDESVWRHLTDTTSQRFLAIVPEEWVSGPAINSPKLTVLDEIGKARLVLVGASQP